METKWIIDNNNTFDSEIELLSKKTNIDKTIASILYNKGCRTFEDIDKYLNPKLKHLHSPKHMMDMDKGTEAVIKAIREKKKIVIYGDYDCDGVTSTAVMYKGLLRCGAYVSYHIPDRIEEGYGMNSDTVRKLSQEGFDLIVTCDNGISCMEQVELAKSLGMQVVVTDHHEVTSKINEDGSVDDVLPGADAVINPKRHEDKYPFKYLAGVGVAFKFIHTLFHKLGIDSRELYNFLEFVAIGTICDVVDLSDENRILASMGLKMLNSTKNKGLKALIKEVGYEGKRIKAGNVGFQIGPCINATGRLDSARLSVELLLCEDEKHAEELAKKMRGLNQERQFLTDKALEEIISQIEYSDIKNDRVLVVYKENLHESLAGIIAGRIRERYNKPSYVITKAKDRAKGSGRSIEEYNMFEELCKCKDILLGAGGHPMAAGFSLEEGNIPLFRKRLNEICTLTDEDLTGKIGVDDVLSMDSITFDLIKDLEKLEPFGKGNKEPVFMIESLTIDKITIIGRNKEHIRLICRDSRSTIPISAVCFHGADMLKEKLTEKYGYDALEIMENPKSMNLKMDLLFKPTINNWNNTESIQLQLVDFRISE